MNVLLIFDGNFGLLDLIFVYLNIILKQKGYKVYLVDTNTIKIKENINKRKGSKYEPHIFKLMEKEVCRSYYSKYFLGSRETVGFKINKGIALYNYLNNLVISKKINIAITFEKFGITQEIIENIATESNFPLVSIAKTIKNNLVVFRGVYKGNEKFLKYNTGENHNNICDISYDSIIKQSDINGNSKFYIYRYIFFLIKNFELLSVINLFDEKIKMILKKSKIKKEIYNLSNKKYFLFSLQTLQDSHVFHFDCKIVYILKKIIKNLPKGAYLVIKEHPNFGKYYFEKEIKSFNNIIWIKGGDLKNLINNSIGLITFNSTCGLEAVYLDKPVVYFQKPYYYDYSAAGYDGNTNLKKTLLNLFNNIDNTKSKREIFRKNYSKNCLINYNIIEDSNNYINSLIKQINKMLTILKFNKYL